MAAGYSLRIGGLSGKCPAMYYEKQRHEWLLGFSWTALVYLNHGIEREWLGHLCYYIQSVWPSIILSFHSSAKPECGYLPVW